MEFLAGHVLPDVVEWVGKRIAQELVQMHVFIGKHAVNPHGVVDLEVLTESLGIESVASESSTIDLLPCIKLLLAQNALLEELLVITLRN